MSLNGEMLIAAPQRWDEVCFSVPAVRALAASGLKVGILCVDWQKTFWKTLGGLERITYPPNAKTGAIATAIRDKWQASLAWEPGTGAEVFIKAGIPRRLGPDEKALKKQLTHPLAITVDPLQHRVQFYLTLAKLLGVETERPEFFSPVPPRVVPEPRAMLLCPDSDHGPSHEWPLERWEEIAKAFLHRGFEITVASLAGGRGLGKALAAKLGDHTPVFETGTFGPELALISSYPAVVAADGSLPHLASHMGATCATLFGPNDPAWRRPLGTRHRVIRRHVECAPCLQEKCPLDLRCQHELTVERVLTALFA